CLCRLPDCRGASPPELERCNRRDALAAQRVRSSMGPNRRAEIPLLDSAELSAQCEELLLHAAAWPQCRAVVDARQERRPIQLSLFRRRTARVLRSRQRREGAGEEVLPVREQPLLVEVGRQRGDVESAIRTTDRG